MMVFTIAFTLLFSTVPAAAQELTLSDKDRAFLEMVQKDSFEYFRKYMQPETGLAFDSSSPGSPASIAATGFAIATFSIAQTHGWIGYREAYETIDKILETLETKAQNKNGVFYHFLNSKNGKRVWASEASSIDTALLMAGVLLAGDYYKGSDIETRAQTLYEQVDWQWLLNGSLLMSHGWKPETGFLPYYWDMYSEHLILQALALGSPTHPIPKEAWNEWNRLEDTYHQRKIVYSFSGSLFTYQYAQAFIDFRALNDRGINYFENSKEATLANKEFCIEQSSAYSSYSENIWGLSASMGPDGYKAYGALPGLANHDGTVAPYAIASAIVFTPDDSLNSMKFIYENYQQKTYGLYGFKDAFNLQENWWANNYIGIDQGIVVLMLENFLNDGAIWKKFMRLPAIQRWIEQCELQSSAKNLKPVEINQ